MMAESCPLIDPGAVVAAANFFTTNVDEDVKIAFADLYSDCDVEPSGKKKRTDEGGSRNRKRGRRNRRGGGIYEMMRSLATGVGFAIGSSASAIGSLPGVAYRAAVPTTRDGVVNYVSASLWLIISGISYAVATSQTARVIIYPSILLWYSGECATFTASLVAKLGFSPLCKIANWFNNLVTEALIGQPWAILAITSIASSPILSIVAARKLVHIVAKSIVENTIAKFNTIDDATTVESTRIATGFSDAAKAASHQQLIDQVRQSVISEDITQAEAAEILAAMQSPQVEVEFSAAGGVSHDAGIPTRRTIIFDPRSTTAAQAHSGRPPDAYDEDLSGGKRRRSRSRSRRMRKRSKKMYGGKKRRSTRRRRRTRRH